VLLPRRRLRRSRYQPENGKPLSASPLPFYPQAAMLLADGSVMLREVTRRR